MKQYIIDSIMRLQKGGLVILSSVRIWLMPCALSLSAGSISIAGVKDRKTVRCLVLKNLAQLI